MTVTDVTDPGQTIHIPERSLTGTREAKLAALDELLLQLQMLRLVLEGAPVKHERRGVACWRRWLGTMSAVLAMSAAVPTARAQETEPGLQPSTEQSDAETVQPNPFATLVFGVSFEGYYEINGNRPYDRVNLLRAYDTRANVFSQARSVVGPRC